MTRSHRRTCLAATLAWAGALAMAACSPAPPEPPAPPAAPATPMAPVTPSMAPSAAPAPVAPPAPPAVDTQTPQARIACRDEIGEAASAKLVQRCIAVSPATRPPCNAVNPCEMIQGEIERSCALFSDQPPMKECAS